MNTSQRVILHFIIGIIMFGCGTSNLSSYNTPYDESKLEAFNKMMEDSTYTLGMIQEQVELSIKKIKRVSIDTNYTVSYDYKVEGNTYSIKKEYRNDDFPGIVKVFYDPENPEIASLNPIDNILEEKETKASNADLYWSITQFIICAIQILFIYIAINESFQKKKLMQSKATR